MTRILTKEEWMRRKRIKRFLSNFITGSLFLMIIATSALFIFQVIKTQYGRQNPGLETISGKLPGGEVIQQEYLSPNPYSRPQTKLKKIRGIVVHYTANPGTTAKNNRDYFESLKTKAVTYASSHYIIGLDGEIVQCIPLTEESYASNDRNDDTISIECCHPDATGEFNDHTYASLVDLTAELCIQFDLKEKDIIRHYDVTGKLCPKYYVDHEDAWKIFKAKVMAKVQEMEKSEGT